ncbi:hypothetical protein Rhopal_002721-T1 [Rhodotorula paludigena]|uniref:Cytosolic endo-beta-N-acetylglucosaminidase TIM barrel domain-containing protein n=1 Tax=Rhodotorula paludigena TaxID=86838 RepID=A0AAV5GJU5_9BASI|nr:hypothetical protein Rhopal_002721-T1 [Rhodotorula paludigena]
MPRAPAAGPSRSPNTPDYFSSLAELAAWAESPRPPKDRFAAPPVPYSALANAESAQEGRGRLLVCHDYKGGYCEKDDERGYTFGGRWHLVDTFIYFSHHRVSCPPPDWIRSAHVNGTKILGTLIFEWDAGREDIVELVSPSGASSAPSPPASRFNRLSTRHADYLVDLAVDRGFEGWLVNVEVELGGDKHSHGAGSDGQDGRLAWQNAVTDLNFPFFEACDGIFLNYWWRPEHVASTARLIDGLDTKRRKDVCFGIDVFGRGSYGGGGFETWRAMHTIAAGQPGTPSGFSTALFAPGWTVEAESLAHSLDSPQAFARWQADDDYLFSTERSTPSVESERRRHERERREQRGVMRARQLAAATAPSASPLPLALRQPIPPSFDYTAPLAPPPGAELGIVHRPIADCLPTPRPTPCPDFRFYTNFSAGSGHGFFVEGQSVLDGAAGAGRGWTDVAHAEAYPSLLFRSARPPGIEAELVEDDAWEGPRALKVIVAALEGVQARDGPTTSAELRRVPMHALVLPATTREVSVTTLVVWKSTSGGTGVIPRLHHPATETALKGRTAPNDLPLTAGWTRTTVVHRLPASTERRTMHLSLELPISQTIFIGTISIQPSRATSLPLYSLSRLSYDRNSSQLNWTVDLIPFAGHSPSLASVHSPASLRYHIWCRGRGGVTAWLGTTRCRSFSAELGALAEDEGEIEVVAMDQDVEASRLSRTIKSLLT